MRFLSLVFGLMLLFSVSAAHAAVEIKDPENTLLLQLKDGTVVIELHPELAPNHVARIKELTREGFYDGLKFHRVIEGFMAQTGDPTGTGSGGSKLPDLKAEFNSMKHVTGTVSMARASSPDSANSQFFICFKPASFLDGQYTAFGQVIDGMQYVNAIKRGDPQSGAVVNPDKIISMKVAADVNKAAKGGNDTKPAPASKTDSAAKPVDPATTVPAAAAPSKVPEVIAPEKTITTH